MFRLYLAVLVSFCGTLALSQNFFVIDSIHVEGNNRTKNYVIINELIFNTGDTIPQNEIAEYFKESRNNLLNTQLFNIVELNIGKISTGNKINVEIEVVEGWAFFPVPILELEDDNLNIWAQQYNYSLERVNIGLAVYHSNVTGRRDYLKFVLQTGFANELALAYRSPYFFDNKFRFKADLSFNSLKRTTYTLEDNLRQDFYDEKNKTFFNRSMGLTFEYRPQLRLYHIVGMSYNNFRITDTFSNTAPEYLAGTNQDIYPSLFYTFAFDRRDDMFYPTKGFYINLGARKDGFFGDPQIDNWFAGATFSIYLPWGKKAIFENAIKAGLGGYNAQYSYLLTPSIMSEPFYVRGFDNYSFKSFNFIQTKTSIHYKFYEHVVKLGEWFPFKRYNTIPLRFYGTANFDQAYVKNDDLFDANRFFNTSLLGYGIGLNVVIMDRYTAMFEYSFNNFGESGFYLHYRNAIN